jgi:signal transduction histidine kinase
MPALAGLPRLRSVRARTTALAAVLVTAALTLGSMALVTTLDRSLTRAGDDLSRSRVEDLATLAVAGGPPRTLPNLGDDAVAQVVAADGSVVSASPNIEGAGPISRFSPAPGEPTVRTMTGVPDDDETEDYRVWVQRVPTGNGALTVYVGRSLESTQEVIARLTASLLVGLPLVIALLAGAIWVLVGRALRPVENIRSEVAAISHRGLDRRVPVPATADEFSRLAETMNSMLARLEAANAQQQDFVANASHDLQSPLASLRAQLDVALAHPETADWRATATALHAEADRMERLVRDLLFLARADAGESGRPSELVDLDDVVLEESARVRTACPSFVDTSRVTAAPVRGSRDDLARLVRNLLENAREHAESLIDVTLSNGPRGVTLTVEDDGPGVPAEHVDRVFDRFYRADEARSRSESRTGLGLAIVRSIAERHQGSVELVDGGRGARFVVRLPSV